MVNVDNIKAFNARLAEHKNKINGLRVRVEMQEADIQRRFNELSQLIGTTVTVDNIEQLYQSISSDIENQLSNGNAILDRIEERVNDNGASNSTAEAQSFGQSLAGQMPVNINMAPAGGFQQTASPYGGQMNPSGGQPQYGQGTYAQPFQQATVQGINPGFGGFGAPQQNFGGQLQPQVMQPVGGQPAYGGFGAMHPQGAGQEGQDTAQNGIIGV